MTEEESNRIWREAHRKRRQEQIASQPVPDWANDKGDRLGMLYGLLLAVGGVLGVTLLLRVLL